VGEEGQALLQLPGLKKNGVLKLNVYDEEGEGSYDGSADRTAWLDTTLSLPFTA
jgi:hypothetical protein